MPGSFSASEFAIGFIAGCLTVIVLLALVAFSLTRAGDIYGLGHWKLNLRTPFPSMWMNLGFWTRDDGKPIQHFDEAARNMLEKLLQAAGLMSTSKTQHSVAVLDVGFGCGDQTVAIAELLHASSRPQFRYVGLTLNAVQLQAAQQRLDAALAIPEGGSSSALGLPESSFKLFQADAAKPESWSHAVCASVDGLADEAFRERWLMGLDCLYHFSPSRKPIFKRASQTLNANVMAFDLVLSDTASAWQVLAVRLLGFILLCPWRTFLTEEQYRDQLVECGYDRACVEIRDISDHVFGGLAGHLRKQDAALSPYGVSLSGYTMVGRIYEWFDRTRVLKAAIVVGRLKSKSQ
ncbi:uncharacterized protein TRIVIDRAFT_194386 [Trichoderma virens Gv29-8]|uniref:Methyltransferase domain-containing protein n=1 Tax=Hypocrea virens (strain Gv29-8 / FGSC 10586) TaxID=413071 RepID=G9N521_HYPVG|nr:uncharacterized protein TRIVIDRAFT_194386 [Trichoderma virens Gv29-8]EHK17867.1 hypothetical protein TRIVIDRAFT_194386 [Trichoderma virens Gv29-8]UKZ54270.1 hypothetical protein TrVGV298_008078 [Trichoderma virens]